MSDLKGLLKQFDKAFQKPTVQIGVPNGTDPERIPTGLFQFDLATGGGFPTGRLSLLYGPESSMKTTLALLALAYCQKKWPDKKAVFVDVEHHFSKHWAKLMGVDTDQLVYVNPETGEQVVDIVEALIYAEDVSIIVVDSLAAMISKKELDSPAEKDMVGTAGLLINKLYRKTGRALGVRQMSGFAPALVFVNQIRFKIGVMHGNPETMPGGPAFKFASSMTVRLYGKDHVDKEVHPEMPSGKEVSFILKKWKVPVVAVTGTMVIATMPNPKRNLKPGQSYDWNTVLSYLKKFELLKQAEKKGWDLTWADTGETENFLTQDAIQEQSLTNPEFAARLRTCIVKVVLDKGDLIDPE